MKSSILFSVLISAFTAFFGAFAANAATSVQKAPQDYRFEFKAPKFRTAFSITKKAMSKEIAFKLAASECFSKLTGDKYPGEEKGLEIIDICANPKM